MLFMFPDAARCVSTIPLFLLVHLAQNELAGRMNLTEVATGGQRIDTLPYGMTYHAEMTETDDGVLLIERDFEAFEVFEQTFVIAVNTVFWGL